MPKEKENETKGYIYATKFVGLSRTKEKEDRIKNVIEGGKKEDEMKKKAEE